MNSVAETLAPQAECALCCGDGGELIVRARHYRVVVADEPWWPGFVRVIWNDHVRELSDLAEDDRATLLRAVVTVERVQRELLRPDKVNLASFGNVVDHLHWHVIPRWRDDPAFPGAVWAWDASRLTDVQAEVSRQRRQWFGRLQPDYHARLRDVLSA